MSRSLTEPRQDEPSDAALVEGLVRLLELEQIEENFFRGPITSEPWTRVYGGQVVGQALMAAARTVPAERPAHSLHAYFMRPGNPQRPILYEVFRDRDGGSFTSRRVVAIQDGKPILNLAASFAVLEGGLAHQAAMPDVPLPEGLPDDHALAQANLALMPENRARLFGRRRPIVFRPVAPETLLSRRQSEPRTCFWFRAVAPLPDDPRLHRVVLAYASDMMLLATSLLPHGYNWTSANLQEASLDHAVWFHEDVRVDEWLLYAIESPWAGHARGLSRASIFARDGKLVASTAQEGLIRVR